MDSIDLSKKIRTSVLTMISRAGSSHIASCLSCADLIAVAYADVLSVHPENPESAERDRFVMSKGHAGATVYAALAELGFFSNEVCWKVITPTAQYSRGTFRSKEVPGVEVSTGSLGLGLGMASGMAYHHVHEQACTLQGYIIT